MPNPAQFILNEAQKRTVESIADVYGDGTFYAMENRADYRLEEVIKDSWSDYGSLRKRLSELLLKAPAELSEPEGGCTVFTVKNREGHVLVGRNYDFKHDLSVVMVKNSVPGQTKSFGMANARFLDFTPGQLSDGITDVSRAVLFPFLCVDGMNEHGVFVSVLVVPGRGTMQDRGLKKTLNTLAMRTVLDKAESLSQALDIFLSQDLQIDSRVRDFHFMFADGSGRSAVLEYEDCEPVITYSPLVTNFRLGSGLPKKGEGMDRYKIVSDLLEYHDVLMERRDVMDVLRLVSQPSGRKRRSDTLWSAVYDLTAGELDLAVGHRYDAVQHYRLQD